MRLLVLLLMFVLLTTSALAHFGALIPGDDIVSAGESLVLSLQLKFIHPTEQHYLEMAKPQQFGVQHDGKRQDLVALLMVAKGKAVDQDHEYRFWRGEYKLSRPGDYTFFVEPQPYWEETEDRFIVHYSKVCISALGREDGWSAPLGLETEIVPLTRPYGLWTGNLFSGQVLLKGQPVPFARLEVEYLNEAAVGGKLHPPADPFITQVVLADGNGIFHYAMPKAGWWGFAALSEADWTLPRSGVQKTVEIGAIYWVRARDLQ